MPRTSKVTWNHFDKFDAGEKIATCKYCKKNLSYRGTTANLKTHLKLKHFSVYSNLMEDASARMFKVEILGIDESGAGAEDEGGSCDRDVVGRGSGTPLTRGRRRAFRDTDPLAIYAESSGRIGASSGNRKNKNLVITNVETSSSLPKKRHPGNKKVIDKCLVKLIAYDFQPFSIVEDIGFKEFVHALNPSYDLPSKKTISSSLIPAFYKERRQYFLNYVKENAETVCLSVECWSSKTKDQYMGVMAHFFSNELELKSVLLQCVSLDGSHTVSKIAQELLAIVQAWGLSNKVNFLVSDNAANMLRASSILGWDYFGCFEHKLNSIVQDALATNKETIEKVTKIVSFLKKTGTGKENLTKYQQNNENDQPLNVITCIPTRWNSVYLMLERFYSLREAIQTTVATLNVSLPVIPNEEWGCIEQICIVLKPFYEVSIIMSEENYLTASTAMVLTGSLMTICDTLTTRELYTPVIDMLEKLKQGLKQKLGDLQSNINIATCTVLDPRYKEVAFSDTFLADETKSHILRLMKTMLAEDDTPAVQIQQQIGGDDYFSIWGEFDLKITSSNLPKTAYTKATEELEMYLKENVISRKACPLAWWRTHKCIYPTLYQIFKSKCNILVTSVPCEQAFSKAGYIINDRRTRLTTSQVGQIMFLNVNKLK